MVAQETARIIVNQGIRDYHMAKLKAAERLGLHARGSLPGNGEIEQAIEDYHQIFGGDSHQDLLRELRRTALRAMAIMRTFEPRLVGPVLNGTADENSVINLHAFTDSPESLSIHLQAAGYDNRTLDRRLKTRKDAVTTFPAYEFVLDGHAVQTTVFPYDGIRQAPLSPVDGRPMRRADDRQVAALLETASSG
jgi:hypothetical protein